MIERVAGMKVSLVREFKEHVTELVERSIESSCVSATLNYLVRMKS